MAQRLDQKLECRRGPTAGVIEVIARQGRNPVGKNAEQAPAVEVRLHLVERQEAEAKAVETGIQDQIDRIECQLPFDMRLQRPGALGKRPGVKRARGW